MAYCLMDAYENAALHGTSTSSYLHVDAFSSAWTLVTREQYGKANRSRVLCMRCNVSGPDLSQYAVC